jgi:subtilase family serine protease
MPEGTDLGETLYDVSSVSPATPGGFSITEAAEPPNCNPRNIGIADISGPFLNVVGPFTLPDRLIEKKPFTISYIFSNSGNQDQPGFDVTLLIDGNPESTKSVAKLSPGQTATLQWNVTKEIEGFTHSFDLDRNPGNISHSQLTFEPAPK